MHQFLGDLQRFHRAQPYQGWRRGASLAALVWLSACGRAPTEHCGTGPLASLALPAADCARVQNLLLPATLPASLGNRWADDDQAALLGFQLFYDARLSANGDIRCATCHQPENHFSDGLALPQSLGPVTRNAANLLNAAWNHWQSWDGHADSVWSQPLFALEATNEMGSSRLALLQTLAGAYAKDYTAIFGALPDVNALPAAGMPGDAAYDRLGTAQQQAVNTVAANVGKALEAYVRRVAAGRAPLDQFLMGDANALSPPALHGLQVFATAGCIKCHSGANLSDDSFYNLGLPAWPDNAEDAGRAVGLMTVVANPFNAHGPYADGGPYAALSAADAPSTLGAFKTPSLRNLIFSAPYGHNGSFARLDDILAFHLQGGGHSNQGYLGQVTYQLLPQDLSQQDQQDLLTFLRTGLTGSYRSDPRTPPNWWDWPDR